MPMIARKFGTFRGAVRLVLSYAEVALGIASIRRPALCSVKRLVFVCHGNICRSAYAAELARRGGAEVASFGLSTRSGKAAHPPIVAAAAARGLDLSAHRATALADYEPREGDYLLAMETRHLRTLSTDERLRDLPRGLLGAYAPFPVPHLHDPYEIDEAYLPACLDRIESAVAVLCDRFAAGKERRRDLST